MINPDSTVSLVIEREMPHPPEKIWRALTQGALIEEWLMKNDFQPVVGNAFHFRSTPVPNWDGVIDCEVLVVEPNSRLSYSWGTMGMKSVVAWPVWTVAAAWPLPIRVPPAFRASTVTFQPPKARLSTVSDPPDVDCEKAAPFGPVPLIV